MNREIKFRAWDKDEKRMLEVYRIGFDGPIDGAQVYCYLDDRGAKGSKECFYDGDGLTLEQYTGLTDFNGKDIYEGDIVTVQATNDDGSTDGMLGKIVYDEDIASFEFTTTGKDDWYTSSFDNLFEEGFFDIHVIGNVHTNSELLEAEK